MAEKLKVITCNILHGGKVMENLIPFLKEENADVLLLQEVNNSTDTKLDRSYRSIQRIQDNLSYRFSHFAPIFNQIFDFGEVEMGNAIFSHFPIIFDNITFFNAPYDPYYKKEEKNHDYSHDPCNLQHTTLRLADKTLDVFNIHGIWELSGRDTPERLKMSSLIVEQIRKYENVILGGDFNVRPDTETIQNIEKHLTNVFKDDLTTTFNMKRKTSPGYATAVVDMLFISPNIQIIEKKCPDIDVSDHLPLVATIEL